MMLLLILLAFLGVSDALDFKILHINDMHARVEGIRGSGGCVQEQNDLFECDGGWARLLTAEASDVPVIFIDNGDQFSGTAWSSFYRGEEVFTLKNKFCSDAGFLLCISGLGNHEFDFEYEALINYVSNSNHDFVVSNVVDNCDSESGLNQLAKRSKVVDIDGKRVGFVGYVTSDTPDSSSPPDCLVFELEEDAIGREIGLLKTDGVEIIIVVGHAGLEKEAEIASLFSADVDLVVGGHSHSFLWNVEEQGQVPFQSDSSGDPTQDVPVEVYPLLVDESTPVVQAFFGSRYLGAVGLEFTDGVLSDFTRESVIVSDAGSSVPGNVGFLPDPSMQETVTEMLQPLLEFINKPIGNLGRDLEDSVNQVRRVRQMELPLGNFACDAMLANAQDVSPGNIDICMQNGGGIRSSIEAGEVTFGEMISVFPFGNVVSFLNFSGQRVHEALEFSVSLVPEENGGFLQLSRGMEVFYDPLLAPFERIVNISLNGDLIPNDESEYFGIVTNAFTAGGGDGFGAIFSEAEVLLATGEPQENVIAEYLANNPNICQTVEGRVVPIQNPIDEDGEEVDFLGDISDIDNCEVKFTILHINDMHARVQGMRGTGGCTTAQNNDAECDGGWGRLLAAGKQIVAESDKPVVFVDNGDEFAGTVWNTFYQGQETYTFLNQLCETIENGGAGFVACFSGIGNHEFDGGYSTLLSFAKNLKHEVINSNIVDNCGENTQEEAHEAFELGSLLIKERIIEIQGKQIAFVGYTLPETAGISSVPSCVSFLDEEVAMNESIERLTEANVDLIIAIGHSGITKDLEIAKVVPEIDLIVGGHTHTFLWNEAEQGPIPAQSSADVDEEGNLVGLKKDVLQTSLNVYPRFEEDDDTPVLQAFFGSRYLGAIDLTFDFDGVLKDFERKSVLLGNKNSKVAGATVFDEESGTADVNKEKAFEEDEVMMRLVESLLGPLEEFSLKVIGEAFVPFESSRENNINVRTSEMPLGNLVCDSMMDSFNSKVGVKVDICMQNGGGIRAPIEKGVVNFGQIVEVHPFGNVVSVLEFTGSRVHEACEFSVSAVEESQGRFLQFNKGFELVYDPRKEVGSRVVSIKLNGEVILNDESQTFNIVTNSFVAEGGDLFGEIFSTAEVIVETGETQEDVLVDYLVKNCPVCVEVDGRVIPLVNPITVDGEVIDVVGAEFERCVNVPDSCDTSSTEEDSNLELILRITIGIFLSVGFVAVVVFNYVKRSKDSEVSRLSRTIKERSFTDMRDTELLNHYTL